MADPVSIMAAVSAAWDGIRSSALFIVLSIFFGIYATVLLVDIILLIVLRDVKGDIRATLYGEAKHAIVSKSKMLERWEAVEARLATGNRSQFKVAILEADAIASRILGNAGFSGKTMAERIASVGEGQIASLEPLREAHLVCNRIVKDSDFSVSEEETREILSRYRAFLDELEVL